MKEAYSINILCLGDWNKKIFNPKWVGRNLFELESDEIQAFFNPNEMEIGYVNNGVALLPKNSAVEIKLDSISEESKKYSGILLNKILSLLPHTPIRAIGFNFRYEFHNEEANSIVQKLNSLQCQYNEFTANQIKFSKEFERYQLNIIAEMKADAYNVNLNFHHSFNHYPEGFAFTDDAVLAMFQESQKIIENE